MLISTKEKKKKVIYTKPYIRIFQIDKSVTDQQQKAPCKTSLNKTLHMLPKVLDRSLPLSKGPAHNLYIIYMACSIAVYVSYCAIEYAIAKIQRRAFKLPPDRDYCSFADDPALPEQSKHIHCSCIQSQVHADCD